MNGNEKNEYVPSFEIQRGILLMVERGKYLSAEKLWRTSSTNGKGPKHDTIMKALTYMTRNGLIEIVSRKKARNRSYVYRITRKGSATLEEFNEIYKCAF